MVDRMLDDMPCTQERISDGWRHCFEVIEPLSIEEVRTLEGFEALKDPWNELVERADSPHLSSTFSFAFAWWKNRNYGSQLFTLLVKQGERLVGIAPLIISEVQWGMVKGICSLEFR